MVDPETNCITLADLMNLAERHGGIEAEMCLSPLLPSSNPICSLAILLFAVWLITYAPDPLAISIRGVGFKFTHLLAANRRDENSRTRERGAESRGETQ